MKLVFFHGLMKSEVVNRFPSHIQPELCAVLASFGSIFPSFHIHVGTELFHRNISYSKETLPFDL